MYLKVTPDTERRLECHTNLEEECPHQDKTGQGDSKRNCKANLNVNEGHVIKAIKADSQVSKQSAQI